MLELMLICNWAIFCAVHHGLLLKSLKALWANPRSEYTLGNLLNEYHAAKEARGGAAGSRRREGCAGVVRGVQDAGQRSAEGDQLEDLTLADNLATAAV